MKRPRPGRRQRIGVATAGCCISTFLSDLSACSFVLAPTPPQRRVRVRIVDRQHQPRQLTLQQSSVSFSDLAQDYVTRVEPVTTMFLEEMIAPFAGDGGDDDDRPKTPKLLDVGCGCGGGAIEAAKAGFDVTAIDSSPAFIGRLSERCEQSKSLSITFEVADGQNLPAKYSDEFDFAVSAFALIFFSNPLVGLQETHRCLVPGGRLVISGWGDRGDSPAFRIIPDAVRAQAPELISASNKKKPFLQTPEEVVTLMEQAGFVDIEITPNVRQTLTIPSAEEYFERFAMGSPPTKNMMMYMQHNMGDATVSRFKVEVMKLAVERGGGNPDGPIDIVSPAYFVYGTKRRNS